MTDDKIALSSLLEKSSDTSFLREMIGFAAERLMQLETETLCNAAPGERAPDRRTSATATVTGIGKPAPDGREGADRRDPGSLYPRYFNVFRR